MWIVGYSSGIAYRPIPENHTETTYFKIKMTVETKERLQMWIKIVRRTVLLFLLGYLLALLSRRFMFWTGPIRIMGVLQRISLCFFAVTFLHVVVKEVKYQIFILAILQWIYIVMMFFFEVPDYEGKKCGKGNITAQCSGASYVDRLILTRNFLWNRGHYDPEGLLSTLSAILTSYIGKN